MPSTRCHRRASPTPTRIGREWIMRIRHTLASTQPMPDDERAQTLQGLQSTQQGQGDLPLLLPAEPAE